MQYPLIKRAENPHSVAGSATAPLTLLASRQRPSFFDPSSKYAIPPASPVIVRSKSSTTTTTTTSTKSTTAGGQTVDSMWESRPVTTTTDLKWDFDTYRSLVELYETHQLKYTLELCKPMWTLEPLSARMAVNMMFRSAAARCRWLDIVMLLSIGATPDQFTFPTSETVEPILTWIRRHRIASDVSSLTPKDIRESDSNLVDLLVNAGWSASQLVAGSVDGSNFTIDRGLESLVLGSRWPHWTEPGGLSPSQLCLCEWLVKKYIATFRSNVTANIVEHVRACGCPTILSP